MRIAEIRLDAVHKFGIKVPFPFLVQEKVTRVTKAGFVERAYSPGPIGTRLILTNADETQPIGDRRQLVSVDQKHWLRGVIPSASGKVSKYKIMNVSNNSFSFYLT